MSVEDSCEKKIYKKVMVIDDTEVDRYIAVQNITRYGFAEEIIEFDSAEEAIGYLESMTGTPEGLPELIFLDIRMPDLDGFGFLERYEQLPQSVQNNCIIMMLSTSLNLDDHRRAQENKFVKKFLEKPLSKEKLAGLAVNLA